MISTKYLPPVTLASRCSVISVTVHGRLDTICYNVSAADDWVANVG
jgi:hypothetical protein